MAGCYRNDRPDAPECAAYEDWIDLNVQWLKNMFGDRLVSVIEHVDEKYPHIHCFVLPLDDPGCFARHLNPAWRAKEEAETSAKADGLPAKAAVKLGDVAYKEAARRIQDDYHREVGLRAGLTRIGPRQARLSRAQWKAAKEEARRNAELIHQMDARVEAIVDLEATSEAIFQTDADRKASEIVAKLELADAAIEDAERLRVVAERDASRII